MLELKVKLFGEATSGRYSIKGKYDGYVALRIKGPTRGTGSAEVSFHQFLKDYKEEDKPKEVTFVESETDGSLLVAFKQVQDMNSTYAISKSLSVCRTGIVEAIIRKLEQDVPTKADGFIRYI